MILTRKDILGLKDIKDGNRSNIKYCRTYEIYFKTGQQKDAPSPGQVSYNTVL